MYNRLKDRPNIKVFLSHSRTQKLSNFILTNVYGLLRDTNLIPTAITTEVTEYDTSLKLEDCPPFLNKSTDYVPKIEMKFLNSERFCYQVLYFLKKYNKTNEMLYQFASEIAKYYNIKYAFYKFFGKMVIPTNKFSLTDIDNIEIIIKSTPETKVTLNELLNILNRRRTL